jgi:C4-dicarboxylate-specific signal transduction histidine kinase
MGTLRYTTTDGYLHVRAGERNLVLEDLEYLNRMTTVGQVLPNIAHELNNALQVVGGLVEMLGFRTDLPADAQDKIARIGAQSTRASQMLRELVAFVRREDGGMSLVDVTRLVEQAIAFRRYHLARARIAVSVTGAARGEALARLDASYLRQILLNLIINAEQSLAGRADARLDISILRAGKQIEVRVSDNGAGVPEAISSQILEPFFTTRALAAGLGLTVAEALARTLGGSLALDAAPEGGTVATLQFQAASPSV